MTMTYTEIVLSSSSPRRRELMKSVTADFIIFPPELDESRVNETDPVRFAVQAAVLKAREAAERYPDATVIGADTVVAYGGCILGKPGDREQARSMLSLLSGRRHRVITGVALYRKRDERLLTGWELTYVTFNKLPPAVIDGYLDRGDFHDKAGAYAVQDAGETFVKRIKGDYDNVVGFPVKKVRDMLSLFSRPPLRLRTESSAFPQRGSMSRYGESRIFIKDALPGEELEAVITEERPGRTTAEIVKVISPSTQRTVQECPHFGKCGGCLFQDYGYGLQLQLKQEYLRRTLEGAGLETGVLDLIQPVVPSPSVYGYRNKMEFAFGASGNGLCLGLRERGASRGGSFRGGHFWRRTVPVDRCPIMGPAVESAFPVVLDFAGTHGLSAFDWATGRGQLRHLVLREGKRTGELMAVLSTAAVEAGLFESLADRLVHALPALKAFYHVRNDRVSDVVVFDGARLLSGRPYIEERLDGLTFRLRPMTFFQTNTAAAEMLYCRIRAILEKRPSRRVLGLYCGAGAIEIFAASSASGVIGVDCLPENIAAAAENAAVNNVAKVTFIPSAVEDYLTRAETGSADVVIVDPPRSGVSPRAMRRLLGRRIPFVIYISCNPVSLGRDMKAMIEADYTVESIAPFDFFPHTPHIETLVCLERSA